MAIGHARIAHLKVEVEIRRCVKTICTPSADAAGRMTIRGCTKVISLARTPTPTIRGGAGMALAVEQELCIIVHRRRECVIGLGGRKGKSLKGRGPGESDKAEG